MWKFVENFNLGKRDIPLRENQFYLLCNCRRQNLWLFDGNKWMNEWICDVSHMPYDWKGIKKNIVCFWHLHVKGS